MELTSRPRPRAVAARLAGPVLLLLITSAVYWKLLTRQYTWMDHPDMAYQVLPWYQFQAVEWHEGRFPLWDPYIWAGQPVVGQAQPGAAYPLNWLLFLLPLREGRIRFEFLHWYYILTHYLAALFMYALCRGLGRTRAASILAGASWALGAFVGTLGWPQMLNGVVWTPLVALFLARALRGRRPVASAALAGTFLGVSFLSGHHQIPTFALLAVAAVWIGYFLRRPAQRMRLFQAAVFALFLFLVSAFQALPAYEYGQRSLRWVGATNPVTWEQYVPYTVHRDNSLYPLSLLGILFPGFARHADAWVGVVVASLALVGLATRWRHPAVRVFAAVALGGALLALGGYTLLHGVLYLAAPMVEKARTPAMAIFLFHLGAAVVAAYGLDACRSPHVRAGLVTRRLLFALPAIACVVYAVLFVLSRVRVETGSEYQWPAMTALTALLLAAILHAWRSGGISSGRAAALLPLLLLLEIGSIAGHSYHHRERPGGFLDRLSAHADIAAFLRSRPEPVRIEVDLEAIPYNFGDWHRIDQLDGYLGGLPLNVAQAQGTYEGRMHFALNYYIARKPQQEHHKAVFESPSSGLKVYHNPDAFPRAWASHPQPAICEGADQVRLLRRETDRVVVDAELACRGLVVVSEPFFPGWYAKVDGRAAPVREVYGALRGVAVDAGRHRVEMVYRPRSVIAGAVLTGAGLLCACWIALAPRWGRSR